ncbi:hypothetical protein A2856_00275 [Candidatus Uhrbacteria bacterium RIFCSPHIGHO2_01_FULL_63_20]|uniref:Uncharacterized protein n=1 Tax=Candidatus Uhrbacteria bacterium RIFCSPHIGHO2_01_FULL_63_20 TaxID=1802385 RepID=A0A1F7TMT6_9BACT|nr:MAG: hypothetical protein A2856_00275 [Candidatus Uhrbacteria bacterium RIFCSPHIGHO2_01_FULL_63_20]
MLKSRILKDPPSLESETHVTAALRRFGPMDRQVLFAYFKASYADQEENVSGIRGGHLDEMLKRLHATGKIVFTRRKVKIVRGGREGLDEEVRYTVSVPEPQAQVPDGAVISALGAAPQDSPQA